MLVIAMLVLAVGCGDSNGSNDGSNRTVVDSNGSNEDLVEEQRASAKAEIEDYIKEISPSLSDDGIEYVKYAKERYFATIDEVVEGIDIIKQLCMLQMEQALISNERDTQIYLIESEYDPIIDDVCSWLDDLLDAGIYRGTEDNYNAEIEALDEQLQDIATEKTKKKNYYAQMCVLNGYSQSWLQTKYSEVDSEYKATYDYLVAQKEYLQALWKNRGKYDEYLALLGGLEKERDNLIADVEEEYELKNQEIEQQISELDK